MAPGSLESWHISGLFRTLLTFNPVSSHFSYLFQLRRLTDANPQWNLSWLTQPSQPGSSPSSLRRQNQWPDRSSSQEKLFFVHMSPPKPFQTSMWIYVSSCCLEDLGSLASEFKHHHDQQHLLQSDDPNMANSRPTNYMFGKFNGSCRHAMWLEIIKTCRTVEANNYMDHHWWICSVICQLNSSKMIPLSHWLHTKQRQLA